MSRYLTTTTHTNTDQTTRANRARNVVLAKGVFNVFLALGIMFLPIAVYDGPIPAFVSKITGLQFIYRDADPGAAYALASITMAFGAAALAAGMSHQDDAYKVIATSNGAFAYTALLGCIFSPKRFGSSMLLLAAIQDVVWFFLILNAGGYTIGETIGLKTAVERMKKKKEELEHEREHRERETEKEQQRRDEKQSYEREKDPQGYGAAGTTGGRQGSHAGSGGGGGFGGSGFGTGVQHGGVGSGGHERYSGVGTGTEGEFGSHGLKTEKIRGAQEHQ